MDFEDTPREAEFRARCRAWLGRNAVPRDPGEPPARTTGEDAAGGHERIVAAKAWQARKYDAGWAVLTWPAEYGGQGLGRMEQVIWNQEEARFKTPPNPYVIGHGMLGPTLLVHGTEEQKKRFLPEMARGQQIWCQLFSEPAAGSDLAGLRTTAIRDGDEWVIDGQKVWSTGAHYSRYGMIVTRTDPEVPKHRGLTCFILDMQSPGIDVRPIKQIDGRSAFNEVFLTDVRVPDAHRLGAVGDGWSVALTTLMNERVAIGAAGGGGGFRRLLDLARRTPLGDRPAIEDASVRQRLADFYIVSKGLQFTSYRTLSAISRGATPGPEGSISKAIGAPLAQQMASFAIELQGASGGLLEDSVLRDDLFWQESYLATPGLRIAGGSDEVLRNIIAERVLGLPPEIRVDKDRPFREVATGAGSE